MLQQELAVAKRPLYITTAFPYIRTGETRYDWLGEEPIICIGLADSQQTAEQLQSVSALSDEGVALMQKYYYLVETHRAGNRDL